MRRVAPHSPESHFVLTAFFMSAKEFIDPVSIVFSYPSSSAVQHVTLKRFS